MSLAGAPTAVCRHLRSRGAYGRSPDGGAWQAGSPLEAYWCLATHEPAGPDDGLVHAQACRAGRGCFVSSADGSGGGRPG